WTERTAVVLVPMTVTVPVTGVLALGVVVEDDAALEPPPPQPTLMIPSNMTRVMLNIALLDLFPAKARAHRPKMPDAHKGAPGNERFAGRAEATATALTVRVVAPEPVTDDGETMQIAPLSAVEVVQLKVTLDENPLS